MTTEKTDRPAVDGEGSVMVVTGGAGFIGSNFVRHMFEQTLTRIVVVDKLTPAGRLENLMDVLDGDRVCFVQADIADRAAMEQVFRDHRPTALVNLAAETSGPSIGTPAACVQTNLLGTFVLLDVAREYYASLDETARGAFRLLHVSTDEVYGSLGEEGCFSEVTPYAPSSPYAASKAGADHLVRAYHRTYGLPTLITNSSNNYGPYQAADKLIPQTIMNALDGRRLPIYGTGKNVRDWLHVEDHCAGLLLVLRGGRVGEKYNIGGFNERTLLEVVDAICGLLDLYVPPAKQAALASRGIATYAGLKTFVPERRRRDRRYAMDATRISYELRWRSQHTFATGLAQTVRWYLDNRGWWEAAMAAEGRASRERAPLVRAAGA